MRPGCLPALLLLVTLTSGCSVPLAYNNADRLARWSVSDYVNMNPDQREYFDASVRELLVWHRREHLPRYAEWLEQWVTYLEDGITEAEMQRAVDQVFVWGDEIEQRTRPATVEFLASLTDEQIDELAAALHDSNREIAEPELDVSLEDAQALWQKEFSERLSEFSGRLNSAQTEYLSTQSVHYRPDRVLWAAYRDRWHRDLLALLAHRRSSGFAESLGQLADQRQLYYGPEFTAAFDHNVALTRAASVWMLNSLTETQRQRFASRLMDLADDFRMLAENPIPRPPPDQPPCLLSC